MSPSPSSPRDESASPGEGEAEVIAFPQAPTGSNHDQATPPAQSWPGQLIDLQAARVMAGVLDDGSASEPPSTTPTLKGLETLVNASTSRDDADGHDEAGARASARTIALRSLAARARSDAELRQKLADRGVDAYVIDEVMEGLIREGLINDRQLADDLAHTLAEGKKMGPVAIRQALVKRRISRVIVDEVVGSLDAVESDTLEELARSRMRVLQGLDREVQVRRLVGFLARRGYQGSEVYRAIDRVIGRG